MRMQNNRIEIRELIVKLNEGITKIKPSLPLLCDPGMSIFWQQKS